MNSPLPPDPPPHPPPDPDVGSDSSPQDGVSVVTVFQSDDPLSFTQAQVVALCQTGSVLFAEVLTDAVHSGAIEFSNADGFIDKMGVPSALNPYLWVLEELLNANKPEALKNFFLHVMWGDATFYLHLCHVLDSASDTKVLH